LAEAIRAEVASDDVTLLDAIQWDEPLVPAREGGPRFAEQLYPHVRVVCEVPEGSRIVLVDDVMTSGGHARAIAAHLVRHGAQVLHVVCGGHAVYAPTPDSWALIKLELPDYSLSP
jgi:hypothetical protein